MQLKPIQTHQNSSTLTKTHRNPSKPIETHQNPSKPIKTHQNSSKSNQNPIKTHQNPSEPIRTTVSCEEFDNSYRTISIRPDGKFIFVILKFRKRRNLSRQLLIWFIFLSLRQYDFDENSLYRANLLSGWNWQCTSFGACSRITGTKDSSQR